MTDLVLGPMLRYVGETEATIWVETDLACQVEILGRRARTFEVAGHHYGLVVADGLRPGTEHEYQVALDGVVRWPPPDSPFGPSVLRTLDPGRPTRIAFGSCRSPAAGGPDALSAYAMDLRGQPPADRPDVLLLIGDQVYADEVGPATRRFIEQRRDPSSPPGYQAADFTEYCFLYHEAWSEPSVRWLLSTVPTAMIFDDHDVHDDWNISAAWLREFQAKPWWDARIGGAYLSYWIYQHLGNLSPAELARDELWHRAQEPGDFAALLARAVPGIRWSFVRTFGKVRVIVIDSLARVDLPAPVYQAVCSPVRNMLPRRFQRMQRLTTSRPGELMSRALAGLAGASKPGIRWRIIRGPWFFNMLSFLEFDGRKARVRMLRAAQDLNLHSVCETELS